MKNVLILLVFNCFFAPLLAQKGHFKDSTYSVNDYDLLDGLRRKKAAKKKLSGDTTTTRTKDKKVYSMALPVIGYNPFTGLIYGLAGISSFKLGEPEKTRISSVVPSYTYTTNQQSIFRMNSSIYTNEEKFYVFNSILWSISPQATYGVGGNTQNSWATEVSLSTFKFTLRGYKKVAKNLFVGVNMNYDHKYELTDKSAQGIQDIITTGKANDLSASEVQANIDREYGQDGYNSFWEENNISQSGFEAAYNANLSSQSLQQNFYTTPFGFYPYGTQNPYTYSGFGINLLFDSRDNINTPLSGYYANLLVNTYPTWFGSTYNSSNVYLDLRHYFKLSKNNNTQTLGIWGLANLTFGEVPYTVMPRMGGDDWYASGRGYTAGRYLGKQLLYLEGEYRVNLYKWFGMTFFLNATTVTENNNQFAYVNPGAGIGFRAQVIKASRSTINFDYGIGKDQSSGVYMRFISAF